MSEMLFVSCVHPLGPSIYSFYERYSLLKGPERATAYEAIDPVARYPSLLKYL